MGLFVWQHLITVCMGMTLVAFVVPGCSRIWKHCFSKIRNIQCDQIAKRRPGENGGGAHPRPVQVWAKI